MADESTEIGRIGFDEAGKAAVKEPIIISLSRFKKFRYLDVRKFYEKDGGWAPTTKGITLREDQIDELIKILTEKRGEISAFLSSASEEP
jgi:hypothetical protein